MKLPRRCASIALLVLVSVFQAFGSSPQDFAGQYVLRLGTRNFIVLNLTFVNGQLTGTLSRPQSSTLGSSFSEISAAVVIEPVSGIKILNDRLHFTASKASDPTDKEDYDLKLLSPTQAALQITDDPLDPWPLLRVPPSPALSVATDWTPGKTYSFEDTEQSNPEMQRIVDADQKARNSADLAHMDWPSISKQDALRRTRTCGLLQSGALHSGKDFENASIIFQHGSTPDDYLLAHTLATLALARGDSGALWMACATLDRYLRAIKQPQVFGTQFNRTKTTPWTQEPYNRTLISDALRKQLDVPTQAAQAKQLEQYKTSAPH